MRLDRFEGEREAGWQELEELLARTGGRADRLEPDGVRRLGGLYRAAAADLSLARRAFPGEPVTARLEALVLRARQAVYAEEPSRGSLRSFLLTGYWRRVRERPGLLWLATALLFGPMVLAAAWGLDDPGAAIGIVPEAFAGAGEGDGSAAGTLSTAEEAALSSEILTNNIRVSLLAIAGGLLLGLGTAAVTIFNGAFIGAIAGLAIGGGDAETFFALVVPHGVLELSCIVIAVVAGLRIGWAIVEPGTLTRGASLRREARPAMELVLGTMPWFVLAGVVEGFVTGSLPGLAPAIAVGVGLGALYWGLVAWRGAAEPARGQSRARALAWR
jgi:uncharacterized membrane protein SpoIIM required for sporulation